MPGLKANVTEFATQPELIPYPRLRQFFRALNRYFMVPVFRLGLGAFVGSPLGGYIMVVKTVGRKTGRARYTPVNYAIIDGQVYCLAGWKEIAHWYRNLRANPKVELIMPGGAVQGIAEQVTDPDEWLHATRQVLRNAGFAGFLLGANPFTASDELVREKAKGTPVICIRPMGIASGAGDPGGWLWVLVTGIFVWVVFRASKNKKPEAKI